MAALVDRLHAEPRGQDGRGDQNGLVQPFHGTPVSSTDRKASACCFRAHDLAASWYPIRYPIFSVVDTLEKGGMSKTQVFQRFLSTKKGRFLFPYTPAFQACGESRLS
jgi:hypothetical protein